MKNFSPNRFRTSLSFAILLLLTFSNHNLSAQNFTNSNLPIVIINTDDGEEIRMIRVFSAT
ncbi:hypothetical protein [Flavobacterium sp. 3HN19-14]|uniref:hypothetical protein n=1 Tax=Flavobacterium sp. 3HN19-14 TaxID=3448133 RepID=UPI003EE409A7